MAYKSIHQKELEKLMSIFFQPRSYGQKLTVAKIFVMRWALASGIELENDEPDTIRWCK